MANDGVLESWHQRELVFGILAVFRGIIKNNCLVQGKQTVYAYCTCFEDLKNGQSLSMALLFEFCRNCVLDFKFRHSHWISHFYTRGVRRELSVGEDGDINISSQQETWIFFSEWVTSHTVCLGSNFFLNLRFYFASGVWLKGMDERFLLSKDEPLTPNIPAVSQDILSVWGQDFFVFTIFMPQVVCNWKV